MKIQSNQMRFYEALAPLGIPDLSTKASGRGQRSSRGSQLKNLAEAVGRWSIIGGAVVLLHLAALRYVF